MTKARLRYAPSPTGRLHVGGARTALFNYLYAKHLGGDFLIRIEDTDIDRNIEDGEKNQIENLEWMGIVADVRPGKEDEFGPYRQSERGAIYDEHIKILLDKGVAYKCYCSAEELEVEREAQKARGVMSPKYNRKCLHNPEPKEGVTPSIRIKMPEDVNFTWVDGVRGEISVSSNEEGDWVAMKSNGIPTYSFANVVDDHLHRITHVLRGEEHISNTPKQIHLYNEFGFTQPEFSHLTIITDETGKKLSKRNETVEQFMDQFITNGYLPEALLNFMSLLGWSPKSEQEIFTKDELVKLFTLDGLSKSSSMFDIEKLKWTNNKYIQKLGDEELFKFLSPYITDLPFEKDVVMQIIKLFQPGLHVGNEITEHVKIFTNDLSLSAEQKSFVKENKDMLSNFKSKIESITDWTQENIKSQVNALGSELDLKGKTLFAPIRMAVSGQEHGPDLSSIIMIYGKDKVLSRLGEADA